MCSSCCIYRESYMSLPLVADIEDLTYVLPLLQISRILHKCSPCCRYRGSYMCGHLVADIEDLTCVFTLLQI